ncbi:hypothetical protein OH76DRAFT_1409108 [Lentinus brumalis]|uniref:C2H2-type domain-containing protein n=1 Tax=Lentinus brumalis TaxID=2498619 RepID=A0A371CVT3_9APHY|nr:hypothetical protein OH76DRAFT_1409108 [Polyporus brumalis]
MRLRRWKCYDRHLSFVHDSQYNLGIHCSVPNDIDASYPLTGNYTPDMIPGEALLSLDSEHLRWPDGCQLHAALSSPGTAKAVLLVTLSCLSREAILEVAIMAASTSAPSSPASSLATNPPQAIYSSPSGSSEVVVATSCLTTSALHAAWAPDASAYTMYLDDNGVRQFKCNWLYCPRSIQGRLSNFWDHYETHNPDRKVFRCEWPECVATRTRERELKRHAQTHLETLPPKAPQKHSTTKTLKKNKAHRPSHGAPY